MDIIETIKATLKLFRAGAELGSPICYICNLSIAFINSPPHSACKTAASELISCREHVI